MKIIPNKGMLIGSRWVEKSETVDVDADRAKKLIEQGHATRAGDTVKTADAPPATVTAADAAPIETADAPAVTETAAKTKPKK